MLVQKRRNLAIEWTLGVLFPAVVAGPFCESLGCCPLLMYTDLVKDYIVQWPRFQVDEGFGCAASPDGSVLEILLVDSWTVLAPLTSILVYYRASRPYV